jgi:hypothetical protein
MRAAVTWSGDVGQALVDYLLAGAAGDPAAFYDAGASPPDLYGDIDGYLLGTGLAAHGGDVAALLTSAYVTGDLETTRFSRFLAALGDDPRATATREITCYARAFAGLSGQSLDPAALAEAAPYFIGRFLAFVEDGARGER